MNGLVLHAPEDLRLESLEPEILGPGQVRLRIKRGGICGSDLHYYFHGGFGPIKLREPMILGHEISGVIEDVGAGVLLRPGMLVAVSPSRPCNTCRYCLAGQQNHCENMRFYGSAMPMPHIQGAFRQELVVDESQCAVADGLTPAQAAMAEPLSVCLHALHQAGDILGASVLITGSGPIGVLTALAARSAGAGEIVVTDILDAPLEFARIAGADRVVNTATHPDGLAKDQAGKGRFDVHFECSSAPQAISAGIAALRPGGVLVQLGLGGDQLIPLQQITAKEVTLKGSFRFHNEFQTAVSLMRRGLLDVSPFVTHTFSIRDHRDAFKVAKDKRQSMKVQFDFS
jgi:L-idonate 5-dehydrogenase